MRPIGNSSLAALVVVAALHGCASSAIETPPSVSPAVSAASPAASANGTPSSPLVPQNMLPPTMTAPPAMTGSMSTTPANMAASSMTPVTIDPPDAAAAPAAPGRLVDPGTMPWVPVPKDQVADKCKLDVAKLDAVAKTGPLAVVRYGLLCYESTMDPAAEIWSVSKTLGSIATGMAMYQTRDLKASGPKTGPLDQFDRVDKWLDNFSFNKDALIAHVLAMEAHNTNLESGLGMMYDTIGSVQINRLSDVVTAAIAQDQARLGTNVEDFFQRFIVKKLGLEKSSWSSGNPNKVYAYTWSTTLRDMGRVGLMLLNGGVWSGERLLAANYVYNMAHASFEAGANNYGYLTWFGGDPCSPDPVHRSYPHGASAATMCMGGDCSPKYDVGAFSARGMGGQFIDIHRGLDMVVLGKNWGEANIQGPWGAVRPALVALDPMFKGDEQAFCAEYAKGNYAPDLKLWEGEDPIKGGLDSPPIK